MVDTKKVALCVEELGRRRYINVPVGRALDLHNYLRSNKVRSAPPEPSFTGMDSIELPTDIDIDAVQVLLDNWIERLAGAGGNLPGSVIARISKKRARFNAGLSSEKPAPFAKTRKKRATK